MMVNLDWWRQLPAWIRLPISIGVIGLATYLWFGVDFSGRGVIPGLVMTVGIILLFAGPTDAQHRGYHD